MTHKKQNEPSQLFQLCLDQILNRKHPLCIMAQQIEWEYFEKEFGPLYSESQGSPGRPIRLLAGLQYSKHAFNESEVGVVERFIESPYWFRMAGTSLNTSGISFPYIPALLPVVVNGLARSV